MKNNTAFMAKFSILLALEAIFCFTPLGSLPAIGPIVATLGMLPVIITALVLGTKAGTIMGFFAGTFSFIVWTFMPPSPITAFLFTPFYSLGEFQGNFGSILICFLPRILVGTVTGLAAAGFSKILKDKKYLPLAISAALGSLTNTFGVMLGAWLFFGEQYSAIAGRAMLIVVAITVLTSGVPEALVSALICPGVSIPLRQLEKKGY
ncbi:ECF transporter S component [Clostridiaceae bacterium OttesenSCG-928-D20]|nr:ECF transporter S component [Clostridiaceae bacterium OttesenSCG-928-D20]